MHLACHRIIKAPGPASSPGEPSPHPWARCSTARSTDSAQWLAAGSTGTGLWQATGQEGLGLLLSFVTPRLWSWRERVVRTSTSCPSCVGRGGSGARAGQSSSVTTLSPRWSTAQRSQPWSREDTPEHRLLAGASWASCPRPGRQTRITGGGHWGTCATPFVLCQLRRASSPCRRWLGPGCTASAGQAVHTELGPAGSVGPQHE